MELVKLTKARFNFAALDWVIPPIVLSLITLIVYYPSLHYPFQFDDTPNITKFFNIRHLNFSSLFFSGPRWISYWLNTINYKIAGFDPFLYRLINVIFHLFTGILIFYFIFLVLKNLKNENFFKINAFKIALFSSTLFLLHPVQTQTVSYIIQGQLEGLSALFTLLILIFYYLAEISQNKISKNFLILFTFIFAFLSTGTKEIAIVSPFLIMLTDWFFIAQGNWKNFKRRIPLQLSILVIVFLSYLYLLKPAFFLKTFGLNSSVRNNIGNILTKNPNDLITPYSFFISQFKVILHYIFIFLWPFNISVEYDWKLADGFLTAESQIPFIILFAIFLLTVYLLKKNRINLVAFAIIWFFIAIAPRSTFIPSPELLMDYKTYLASIGLLFLISCAIVKFSQAVSAKFFNKIEIYPIIFLFLSLLLGFLTLQRNKVWRSSLEFWENIMQRAPEKARAYNNYGVELTSIGKNKEAVPYFKKAIKLEGKTYWDPYTNLAIVYAALDNIDLAILTLEQSLKLNPYNPEAYNNLGAFFLHKNEYYFAERSFKAAIALRPHYGKAIYNLGKLHIAKEDLKSAWECFKKACTQADLDHDLPGYQLYATTSIMLKKYEDAIFACKKFLQLASKKDDISEALFNLGNAYFLNNNFDKAVEIFKQMTIKFPEDIRGWGNLVETYIKMHKSENALEIIKKLRENGQTFSGIEIQQAVCLANLGYSDLAEEILKKFINEKQPEQLKKLAKQILKRML